MTQKSKGGRGQKAENPYERLSITLPPELKLYLDAQAEAHHLNRSEMVARLLEDHQAGKIQKPVKVASKSQVQEPSEKIGGPSTALTAPRKALPQSENQEGEKGKGQTQRLASYAPVLHVMQRTMPRGQKWTPAKYAQAEALLAEGDTLQAQGVDFVTEKGNVMSWRTAEALVKLGVLVVPPAKM